jgi:hypothetical protein
MTSASQLPRARQNTSDGTARMPRGTAPDRGQPGMGREVQREGKKIMPTARRWSWSQTRRAARAPLVRPNASPGARRQRRSDPERDRPGTRSRSSGGQLPPAEEEERAEALPALMYQIAGSSVIAVGQAQEAEITRPISMTTRGARRRARSRSAAAAGASSTVIANATPRMVRGWQRAAARTIDRKIATRKISPVSGRQKRRRGHHQENCR